MSVRFVKACLQVVNGDWISLSWHHPKVGVAVIAVCFVDYVPSIRRPVVRKKDVAVRLDQLLFFAPTARGLDVNHTLFVVLGVSTIGDRLAIRRPYSSGVVRAREGESAESVPNQIDQPDIRVRRNTKGQ